jgi:hypothetical protein
VAHTVECSGGGTGALWHWYTDGYDVNFSATFAPAGKGTGEAQVLVAPGLTTTNKGIIAPAGPGTLTLTFNNSHSRFRRCAVVALRYIVESLPPGSASAPGAQL